MMLRVGSLIRGRDLVHVITHTSLSNGWTCGGVHVASMGMELLTAHPNVASFADDQTVTCLRCLSGFRYCGPPYDLL